MQITKRSAFTLLELSVVIAIIGLLTGGLYAFSGFIKSSQRTSMINEAKYYMDAAGKFQTQYNAMPGDFANAANVWSATTSGNGNGFIRAGAVAAPAEMYQAFMQLAAAGMITGSYKGSADNGGATASGANANVPASSFPGVAYLLDHPDELNGSVTTSVYFPSSVSGLYAHVLFVAGLVDGAGATPLLPFLSPKEAQQLDDKFDDGKPNYGWIMTPKNASLANCASSDVAGAVYTVVTTTTNPTCYLILRLQI